MAYEILSHNQPDRDEAVNFLKVYAKPDSFLYRWRQNHRGIERYSPIKHEVDIHKAFEYSKTSEMEGMIAVLRTFIRRMCRHVAPFNLPDIMSDILSIFPPRNVWEPPILLEKHVVACANRVGMP